MEDAWEIIWHLTLTKSKEGTKDGVAVLAALLWWWED